LQDLPCLLVYSWISLFFPAVEFNKNDANLRCQLHRSVSQTDAFALRQWSSVFRNAS
jgi:hypothetical protein